MPFTPNLVLTGWTVLVVDDEPDNVLVAQMLLEMHGLTVYTARNGLEALAWLRANPLPDFVLCDISMPKMDGWEVIANLRADPALAHLCVFALTAYAMQTDRERAVAAGFNAHLAKPIDPMTLADDLVKIMREVPYLAPRLSST
ncbi:MAG: response regulator [Anaerolineae bacterium]|jgi:hypothetical protein|nr:response regulator [Anaerolineae bacterium]